MIDDHMIQRYCLNFADYPKKADSVFIHSSGISELSWLQLKKAGGSIFCLKSLVRRSIAQPLKSRSVQCLSPNKLSHLKSEAILGNAEKS